MYKNNIKEKIYKYLNLYLRLKLNGKIFNCPYWSNRIREGKVVKRGFLNGKGDPLSIKNELELLLKKEINRSFILQNQKNFIKFARRNRIGIDCSGFVYQVLNQLVILEFKNVKVKSINEVFTDGINKTDVKLISSQKFTDKIDKLVEIQLGDFIRLNGGRHVVLILTTDNNFISYVHSSDLTQKTGVHLGNIKIVNKNQSLSNQVWLEKAKTGENFGKKYFKVNLGDGIYRLKIFN